jgi:SEC-C motif
MNLPAVLMYPRDEIIQRLKTPFLDDYEGYEDIYLNVLAGEMRLKDAIPVWLDHLRIEADLLNETAEYGLIKVESAEVIQAIGNCFAGEEWGFRLYASGVLENIRLPESEELLCQLLPEEEDLSSATILAAGLCRLLSVKGIRLVKDMIIEGYDEQMLSLEEYLYANCRINNIDLPEMKEWREMIAEQTERNDRQYYENFLSEAAATVIPRKSEKIGRNDPCPCGSGKKFKKCCLFKKI